MQQVTFEQLADLIRRKSRLPTNKVIKPETKFEVDLGITGDDGDELLQAVSDEFNLNLKIEDFELKQNEFLFHSECQPLFKLPLLISLFGSNGYDENVRTFTVGELYSVIQKVIDRNSQTGK